MEAFSNGSLIEVFGTGTAALIANVEEIKYKDTIIKFDLEKATASKFVKDIINGLRDGTVEDRWGWTQKVQIEEFV